MQAIRRSLLRPWVVMPLVAVIALGTWFFLRAGGEDEAGAAATRRTVQATSGPMDQSVSADAKVAAATTDDLRFTSAGTVTAVNVKAGDKVTAGQVLATIDPTALAASVSDAESTVADAEAKLSDDTSSGASDAQLAADQAKVDSANDQLVSARAALAGATLTATVDGTVASVDLTVGEQLTSSGSGGTDRTGSQSGSGASSSTLGQSTTGQGPSQGDDTTNSSATSSAQITVVSTGSYTVTVDIDDTDIAKIQNGQTVKLSLSTGTSSNLGGGFRAAIEARRAQEQQQSGAQTQPTTPADNASATGTVTSVGQVADASTGVAKYPVVVSFTDTSGKFNPGATVTAQIAYNQIPDAVQVPALAVTTTPEGSTVEVVNANATETRTVEVGITSAGMVQITSGLNAGEEVVITLPGQRTTSGSNGANNGNSGGNAPAGGPGEFPGGPVLSGGGPG